MTLPKNTKENFEKGETPLENPKLPASTSVPAITNKPTIHKDGANTMEIYKNGETPLRNPRLPAITLIVPNI